MAIWMFYLQQEFHIVIELRRINMLRYIDLLKDSYKGKTSFTITVYDQVERRLYKFMKVIVH